MSERYIVVFQKVFHPGFFPLCTIQYARSRHTKTARLSLIMKNWRTNDCRTKKYGWIFKSATRGRSRHSTAGRVKRLLTLCQPIAKRFSTFFLRLKRGLRSLDKAPLIFRWCNGGLPIGKFRLWAELWKNLNFIVYFSREKRCYSGRWNFSNELYNNYLFYCPWYENTNILVMPVDNFNNKFK